MSELISDEYLDQLHKMRAAEHNPLWGNGGKMHVESVRALIRENPSLKTVLDYGCGRGKLLHAIVYLKSTLKADAQYYDPGIPEFSADPHPADLVLCTDVLEHIEPALLDNVLNHIRVLTKQIAYLHIAVLPARQFLPDGRNAHLIIQPPEWWRAKLEPLFSRIEEFRCRDGIVHPTFVCYV